MVKWVFFYSWVMPWWVMPWWVIGLCRGVRGSCCGGSRLSFSIVAVLIFLAKLAWVAVGFIFVVVG